MTVAGAPAPRRAGPTELSNAFTVDLEEWFHVCGVDAARAPITGTRCLPESNSTTRWLLDALDHADVRATFFIVGWVADRWPRLVRNDSRGGSRDRLA